MPTAFSEVRRRLVPVLAGGAVALMLMTGCQGSDDPSPTETPGEPSASASVTASATPTASAAAEPSPASSLGPAANLPVPVKPALADENTPEGLEAFTEYWLELFSYGYETNDWSEFIPVTNEGCRSCSNLRTEVQDQFAAGGWVQGGELTLNSTGTEFVENTAGSINSFIDVKQEEIVFFNSLGEEVQRTPEAASVVGVTIALWRDGEWIMLDFGSPEGT